ERAEQAGLGVVAGVLDRSGDEIETAVLRRGVADVGLVLRRRDRLDELELDAGLVLPDLFDRAGGTRRELVLELRAGEVQGLDDERVRSLARLPQGLDCENGPALLRVRRILVALGALEADGAADLAGCKAVRERLVA